MPSDMTTNVSVPSSFLKSPINSHISGPVLGTPDYLSQYTSIENTSIEINACIEIILGPEILLQDENHSKY
jgi:hypothetical protein